MNTSPLKYISILFWLMILLLIIPSAVSAVTLKEALDEAAKYFTKTAVRIQPSQKMVLSVVNYHSQKRDQKATLIETELYFALEKQFPEFKLILQSEALAGVSSENAIFVKGTYEQKGRVTILRFQAVQGLYSGEIVAQTSVEFETERTRRKTLVAVLDLKATSLNVEQKKVFSDIFRTALRKMNVFEIASSAEIDKIDPDSIQEVSGCTRDECATIIGEQLGVDHVISSTYAKVARSTYYLSGKVIDIRNGSILTSEIEKHNGDIDTLELALIDLAAKLIGKKSGSEPDQEDIASKLTEKKGSFDPVEGYYAQKEDLPETKFEWSSENNRWHLVVISMALAAGYYAQENGKKYNELVSENSLLKEQYESNSSATEKYQLNEEYVSNQEEMEAYKSNYQGSDVFTGLLVCWELYLIYDSGSLIEVSQNKIPKPGYRLKPFIIKNSNSKSLEASLIWQWKF